MKRTRLKSINILTIICLTMTLVLSACGSKENTGASDAASQGNQPSQQNDEGNNQKEIKILVGIGGFMDPQTAKDIYVPAMEYQKLHPNVKFEFSGAAGDTEYRQKLEAMANTNSIAYDIFWLTSDTASIFAKKGVLGDITASIDDDFKNAYVPNAFDATTFDGVTYGVPNAVSLQGWAYNKAIWDKYNLELPETYDDLVNAVKVFKENNVTTIAQGGKSPEYIWGYSLLLRRNNWDGMKDSILIDKTGKFNNPDFQKLWSKVYELGELGAYPPNMATMDYTQAEEMFVAGNAAMMTTNVTNSVGAFESSEYANDIIFNWGIHFDDGIEDQKIAIKAINTGNFVSSQAAQDPEKLKVIMDFFKFRASPEMTKLQIEEGYFPPTKFEGDVNAGPVMKQMIEKLNDDYKGVAQLESDITLNLGMDVTNAYYNNLMGVMMNLQTADKALENIDKEAEKYKNR